LKARSNFHRIDFDRSALIAASSAPTLDNNRTEMTNVTENSVVQKYDARAIDYLRFILFARGCRAQM